MSMTTIMIVMVIIMMPIEYFCKPLSLLYSILSGIISGLLATYIFHKRTQKIERTDIHISRQIACSSQNKYTIKISNESPQDAYDIKVYVRLRYKGRYLIIKPKYLPILHGRSGSHKPFDYQRKFSFTLTSFNAKTIEDLNDAQILKLYNAQQLEFSNFARKDTIVEIIVMSIDSISGGVMDVKTKIFSNDELKENVIRGRFHEDTLEIIPDEDCAPEEVDNDNN